MTQIRPTRSASRPLSTVLVLLALLLPGTAGAGDRVWTPIGPYGGTLQSVVFHPSQPGTVWAGTQNNGVFLSTDGGVTWAPTNQGLPSDFFRSVGFLDVSTAGRLTLYMSLHTSTVYRSIEGGRWERMSPDAGLLPGMRLLAADPHRPDVLWGSNGHANPGIAASGDGGATWSLVHSLAGGPQGAAPTGFVFSPADPAIIYAGLSSSEGAPKGVLRSRDGGLTWEPAGSGLDLPDDPNVSVRLEIAADTGVLFASVERYNISGELESRVYRSADGGDHWTLVLPSGGSVTAGAGGLVLARGGHRSLDGGLTWSPLPIPGDSLYVLEAHPVSPGVAFFGLYSRGLFRSADSGASWRESSQGILAAQALDLVADPLDPGTLYASLEGAGLYKTTDGGLVWEHLLPREDYRFLMIDDLAAAPAGGETTLFGVDVNHRILRSEDGGASWTELVNPGIYSLWALAVDPKAPRTVYLGGESSGCPTRKSTDGGETWRCLGLGRTFDLVVDPVRPANLWSISRIVYRSTDRGRTWKPASRGLRTDGLFTLAVAPSAQNVVYVGTWQQGVYKTTDAGRSWGPVNTGLPPLTRVSSLAVHPRNPSIVYAGVDYTSGDLEGAGVYRSTDGGRQWKKLAAGLPVGFRGPLVIDPHDPRTIYAGTASRGFYSITLRR